MPNITKTIKKQVIVGTEKYINQQTGEYQEFTVIDKNVENDYGFHKVWLTDILSLLDNYGTARLKVLTHLLKIMRIEDNTISGSYRELSNEMSISYPVVAITMKELIEANVIKKIKASTYQFNPDLIVKGGSAKRKNLLIRYHHGKDFVTNKNDIEKTITSKSIIMASNFEDQNELDL